MSKAIGLSLAGLLVLACADTTPPDADVLEIYPSFDFASSGNPKAAVFIDDLVCGFLDGDGNPVTVDDGRAVITSSGREKLQCSAKGVPNSTGKAVMYDADNNPTGPGGPLRYASPGAWWHAELAPDHIGEWKRQAHLQEVVGSCSGSSTFLFARPPVEILPTCGGAPIS